LASSGLSLLDPVLGRGVHPAAREDGVDLGQAVVGDGPSDRPDVVLHLGDRAAADQCSADDVIRGRPAKGELRETPTEASGHTLELLDCSDVLRESLRTEEGVEELDRAYVPSPRPPVLGARNARVPYELVSQRP
jgi:hypothetical protein